MADPIDVFTRIRESTGRSVPRPGYPHNYPGDPSQPGNDGESWTSDCSYGCGAWAGPSRSGSRTKGVDPFGECPKNPARTADDRPKCSECGTAMMPCGTGNFSCMNCGSSLGCLL